MNIDNVTLLDAVRIHLENDEHVVSVDYLRSWMTHQLTEAALQAMDQRCRELTGNPNAYAFRNVPQQFHEMIGLCVGGLIANDPTIKAALELVKIKREALPASSKAKAAQSI